MTLARRLTEADADALRALRLRGLKDHPLDFGAEHDEESAWEIERWCDRLRSSPWFGVEKEGALIACAVLDLRRGARVRHNAWVHAMYVTAEAQGARAADAVMDALEAEARAREILYLKLDVREDNTRALAFYRRRGFEPFGREPASLRIDGIEWPALLMAKRL